MHLLKLFDFVQRGLELTDDCSRRVRGGGEGRGQLHPPFVASSRTFGVWLSIKTQFESSSVEKKKSFSISLNKFEMWRVVEFAVDWWRQTSSHSFLPFIKAFLHPERRGRWQVKSVSVGRFQSEKKRLYVSLPLVPCHYHHPRADKGVCTVRVHSTLQWQHWSV